MKNRDQTDLEEHTDFEEWLSRQTEKLPEPEVTSEFLAAQRRDIYRRIESKTHHWISLRWALSLAMLLLIFAGGLSYELRRRAPAPAVSDEQLFSDLSAMEQRNEPKAIQPIHGLFEE